MDSFWAKDPSILINKDRLSEFYITNCMSKDEKLNAIVRFFIYSSILCSLYLNNPRYLLLIILALIITYFINKNSTETFDTQENIDPQQQIQDTVKPTIDNPFMNPNIFDDPTKFKATKYDDNSPESEQIKKDIYNKFSYNLYKDVSDIFDSNNGFRQFYTVPDNINEYEEYKQFMYGDMKFSAKENTYDGFKNLYDQLKNKT